MPTRALVQPRPVPVAVLLTLALGLILMPLPAQAAKGTDIAPTLDSLVDLVSPGEPGAFQTTFTNSGTSTMTDLRLEFSVSGGRLPATLPAGCEASSDTTGQCALGSVAAGAPTISLLFLTIADEPPGGGIGDMTFTATFSSDARQNNPNAAKRDTWGPLTATARVDPRAEVFGRWQEPHAPLTFPAVGGTFQSTTVDVPSVGNGYAALVQHRDESVECTNSPDQSGFGLAVELAVNNGNSPVTVTIAYSTEATGNTPPAQIGVVHQRNDGACVFPVLGCATHAGHANGCFDVTTQGKGKNKTVIVTALLPSNGRIKGF